MSLPRTPKNIAHAEKLAIEKAKKAGVEPPMSEKDKAEFRLKLKRERAAAAKAARTKKPKPVEPTVKQEDSPAE